MADLRKKANDLLNSSSASVCGYSLCSISIILLNKAIMGKIPHPVPLILAQNSCASFIVVTAKWMGWVSYPDFSPLVAGKWLPLSVLFASMLVTSIASLQSMSVAAITVIKNIALLLTAVGDRILFGKQITLSIVLSFVLMGAGSYITSTGDPYVTKSGLCWTFANVFVTVAYVLLMKGLSKAVGKQRQGYFGPIFYNNTLSLPILLVVSWNDLIPFTNTFLESTTTTKFHFALLMVIGSMMSFCSFWCMNKTGPTTYSMIGAFNKIPVSVIGIIIFGQTPNSVGMVGILLGLLGGVTYAMVNTNPPSNEEKEEESSGYAHRSRSPSPVLNGRKPSAHGIPIHCVYTNGNGNGLPHPTSEHDQVLVGGSADIMVKRHGTLVP